MNEGGEGITFAFFQLEMHGGIFHSCCSLTVIWNKEGEPSQNNPTLIHILDLKGWKAGWIGKSISAESYFSARRMHDGGRRWRRSSGNLLVDSGTQIYPRYIQKCNVFLQKIKQRVVLLKATEASCAARLLKARRLHGVFLHLHHTDHSLFGSRIKSHSLLGRRISKRGGEKQPFYQT